MEIFVVDDNLVFVDLFFEGFVVVFVGGWGVSVRLLLDDFLDEVGVKSVMMGFVCLECGVDVEFDVWFCIECGYDFIVG